MICPKKVYEATLAVMFKVSALLKVILSIFVYEKLINTLNSFFCEPKIISGSTLPTKVRRTLTWPKLILFTRAVEAL